jgi:hypothetical protein
MCLLILAKSFNDFFTEHNIVGILEDELALNIDAIFSVELNDRQSISPTHQFLENVQPSFPQM